MNIIGRHGEPGFGPFMHLHFELEGGVIRDGRYETYGCPSASRCGYFAVQWAKNRALQELVNMELGDLLRVVGGLPVGKEFCADITLEALRDATRQMCALETGASNLVDDQSASPVEV